MRDCDRGELLADAMTHVIGFVLAIAGIYPMLRAAAALQDPVEYNSILVYYLGLIMMLTCSAAYNLCPVGKFKWLLRRCDQSGIYVMMAATATPFIVHARQELLTDFPLLPWLAAVAGITMRIVCQSKFRPSSVVPYLAFGVGCMLVYQPVWSNVPSSALWLILVGGCVYTAGIPFYLLERLRFQQVIWHGFVWTATTCHYFALLNCISQPHL